MGISIIICTYNNSLSLRRSLNSLLGVLKPNIDYDIVIVDNNSSDDTKEVVSEFININDWELRYCFFPEQGLAKARNFGIKISKFEYVLFTDDDITFDKEFLLAFERLILERNPEIAGGRILLKYKNGRPIWLSDKIDYMYGWFDYGTHNKLYPSGSYPLGPSLLIKKALLNQLGGFDESMGLSGLTQTVSRGEETELVMRYNDIGVKLWYCGESLVYHNVKEERLTKDWFIGRFKNSGGSYEFETHSKNFVILVKYIICLMGTFIYSFSPSKRFYFYCKSVYFKHRLF